jgi:hypothetical protein
MVLVEAGRSADHLCASTFTGRGSSAATADSPVLGPRAGRRGRTGGARLFRRTGATHLTYNCALDIRWRCAPAFEVLDGAPGLELIASGIWQGKETRLYRMR